MCWKMVANELLPMHHGHAAAERNYAQLEKEVHQYLYGRKFVLVTDHKPLLALLGPKKVIPPLHLQRWAVLLSAYTYDLVFRMTQQHTNADGLSMLSLKTT